MDVPGVVGKIGTALGQLGLNISTYVLGRRSPTVGSEAIALVGLDGTVDSSILKNILGLPSVTEARLIRLPVPAKAAASA